MPMLLEDPFLRQFQFKEPSSIPIHMFPSKKGRANNSLRTIRWAAVVEVGAFQKFHAVETVAQGCQSCENGEG